MLRCVVVASSRVVGSRSSAASRGRALHLSAPLAKVVPFNLPDIGEGIAEVEVLAWHVKPGDAVRQFDKLLEVQSDKATVDITSRFDGVVASLAYKKGDMAKTGTPLMHFDVPDAAAGAAGAGAAAAGAGSPAAGASAATPAGAAAADSAAAAAAAAGGGGGGPSHARALAAPATRRIARELGVPLSAVAGSGKDGRVTKHDVQRFVDAGGAAAGAAGVAARAAAGAAAPAAASAAAPAARAPSLPAPAAPADGVVPLRGFARGMAKSMTAAWAAPHFGYCEEVVVDNLMAARAALKPAADAAGVKLTYLPFLLKAAALALRDFPTLNGSLAPDGASVLTRGAVNVGVAMDTPRGLVVPVVKNVGGATLLHIAAELGRLQAAAAAGKLDEPDLAGGTFTLSNIGSIGGTYAAPVIPPGTAAIGALGRITKLPRYASTLPGGAAAQRGAGGAGGAGAGAGEDALVAAHILTVSWAADHRFVDGATMARFSRAWREMLEQPALMLARMS